MEDIFIERNKELIRIAIKEKNQLKECFIEEENNSPYPGQIYKGVVKNIVPAIKCAFVDIGYKKNCYLYVHPKYNNSNLKKGDEILVEILKEDIGDKGPKVTDTFTVAGSFAVLEAKGSGLSFSQKITDKNFMDSAYENLSLPSDAKVKIRTNGEKVTLSELQEEIDNLYALYKDVMQKGTYSIKPGLIYSDGGIVDRILRDLLSENTGRIICDNEEDFNHINSFIKKRSDVKVSVEFYKEKRNLFECFGIEKSVLELRSNKIFLHCGGYIFINKTEAMYVIDVNSGSNTKGVSIQKTAYTTDLEAAREIARQIRLRNLNGIIIVDFIDLKDKEDQNSILRELNNGFKDDKNKTIVYPFTELSIVQIARRRRGRTITEYIEEKCTNCKGTGTRVKLSYIEFLIKNQIIRSEQTQSVKDILIKINVVYRQEIQEDILDFIKNIDALDKSIYVEYVNNMEYFKIEPLLFSNQISNLSMYKIYG